MSLTVVVTQGGTPTTYTATADAEACLELLRQSILTAGSPTYATVSDMLLAVVNNNAVQPALNTFTPLGAVASAFTQSLAAAALQTALVTAGSTFAGALRNLLPANTANLKFSLVFTDYDAQYGAVYVSAPDATVRAVHLEEIATTACHHFVTTSGDLGAGTHTLSMYFLPDSRTWIYLQVSVDGFSKYCWFNLATGAVGTSTFAGGTTFAITLSAFGFYRCSVTFVAATSATNMGCGLATADAVDNYLGVLGNGVWQFGQQAEHGTLTDYQAIPTGSI
jgi:hypothetical protein